MVDPVDPIDWERKFQVVRETFLDMLADGKWEIEYDADVNEVGRQIDCSTFHIDGSISSLENLCTALDITAKYMQPLDEAITEAVETPNTITENTENGE